MANKKPMAESEGAKPLSVQLACDLPFALYAEGQFQVRLQHGEVSVHLQRIRQERIDPRIGIEKTNGDARGDRYGFLSYSRLSCQMEWST
ncbi:MAG: hypothetical protein Q7T04_03465, partial [Dehalococcoidia bacterium]|nr:hypothetical protein [Dehalococcoidia bacterium]